MSAAPRNAGRLLAAALAVVAATGVVAVLGHTPDEILRARAATARGSELIEAVFLLEQRHGDLDVVLSRFGAAGADYDAWVVASLDHQRRLRAAIAERIRREPDPELRQMLEDYAACAAPLAAFRRAAGRGPPRDDAAVQSSGSAPDRPAE